MNTTHVSPERQDKEYEIEVYVAFYKEGGIFVTAREVGKGDYKPTTSDGGTVERYVFKVKPTPQLTTK